MASAGRLAERLRSRTRRPLAEWAYWGIGAAVVALLFAAALRRQWAVDSDIWEHAAVVRELERHPFDPGHPLMALDAPHSFFSPYALALGIVARLTPLSASDALALAGPANVALLLVALFAFVRRFSARPGAPLLALAFTWLLWGPDPWFYSSFLHLRAIPYVAAYPATFTKAVALLALVLAARIFAAPRVGPVPLVVLSLLGATVLLTHPVDGIFLAVGIGALVFGGPAARSRAANLGIAVAAGSAGLGLAVLWPLYPLTALAFGEPAYREAVAAGDRDLYEAVLIRTFPSLAAVPAILVRLVRNRRDPLGTTAIALGAVYLFGLVSEQWQFGRVISDLVVVGHVALAVEVSRLGGKAARRSDGRAPGRRRLPPTLIGVGLAGLLIVGTFSNRQAFAILVPPGFAADWLRRFTGEPPALAPIGETAFLSSLVGEDDVVLGDFGASWMVPLFSGKVVPSQHAMAFVPDLGQRREDVLGFFEPEAPPARRREVIDRYCARFLLLPRHYLSSAGRDFPLADFGTPIHEDGRFVLVALTKGAEKGVQSRRCPGP